MTDEYVPPKIWTWNKEGGGRFASINRPIAGPTQEKELPAGQHPLQLYSLATPNGVKVTVMLEELLAAGHKGAEYDAWLINIQGGDQFGSVAGLQDQAGDLPGIRAGAHGQILHAAMQVPAGIYHRSSQHRRQCRMILFVAHSDAV